ncbi:UDP-N-acetylglucosamine transferase subunit ALG13 homolog [Vespa crabro]|uniref:UDP-N-acetylglucosamine transferase subunit ALG13 homolog n=1 Tax=Vespa crabro TaxID=7445 RepID=UPI001F021AA4|nr:UDP-N-acetylglucosamine transferase subunit ALG13 homolog [Vespa crabro]
MSEQKVFVTVGTTSFDDLISTILNPEILEALALRGYNYLSLQIGKSSLEPDCTSRCGINHIEYFHLSSSIEDYIQAADLVISHAGAGSILEALEAHKQLIVVTNQLLMDNHQLELARQLYEDKHLYYCTCDTLLNTIQTMELDILKPFISDESKNIINYLDRIMGFK